MPAGLCPNDPAVSLRDLLSAPPPVADRFHVGFPVMKTSKNSSPSSTNEPTSFIGWGTLIGAGLGLGIGLFTRHWIQWTLAIGILGWLVGALIDRSRLK